MLPFLDDRPRACSLRHRHGDASSSRMEPFPAPLFRETHAASGSPLCAFPSRGRRMNPSSFFPRVAVGIPAARRCRDNVRGRPPAGPLASGKGTLCLAALRAETDARPAADTPARGERAKRLRLAQTLKGGTPQALCLPPSSGSIGGNVRQSLGARTGASYMGVFMRLPKEGGKQRADRSVS